jgi:hypothetical protein
MRLDRQRTARHEAGHVVAARRLGLGVNLVSSVPDAANWGHTVITYKLDAPADGARAIVVKLMGYLVCGEAPIAWPPDYADAVNCEYEQLGTTLRDYDVPRSAYRQLCVVALEMAREEAFLRAVDLTAEAIDSFRFLDGAQVEAFVELPDTG